MACVSDNRVGIPKGVDIENPSTPGLQLISALVDQLGKEFELKRDNGTEFIIQFNKGEKF